MIEVSKYHGCGNDFLITRDQPLTASEKRSLVVQLCDRHTGIGADGFIYVHSDPLEMEFYNCDGSRAPMCGNGIRCFARFLYEEGICTKSTYEVKTLAGNMKVKVASFDPFLVSITLGKVSTDPSLIKSEGNKEVWQYPMRVQDAAVTIDTCFIGTIHTVLLVQDAFDPQLDALGKVIHEHPLFLEKTNVNFVEIIDRGHIRLQTYERGVGMTLACGTGCCAAVWDAWKHGRVDREVEVTLRKGTLMISIEEEEVITMRGSAQRIMKGVASI